jgi:hypothetical protein
VLNANKLDLKALPIDAQLQGLTYFLEVVTAQAFLPG